MHISDASQRIRHIRTTILRSQRKAYLEQLHFSSPGLMSIEGACIFSGTFLNASVSTAKVPTIDECDARIIKASLTQLLHPCMYTQPHSLSATQEVRTHKTEKYVLRWYSRCHIFSVLDATVSTCICLRLTMLTAHYCIPIRMYIRNAAETGVCQLYATYYELHGTCYKICSHPP